MKKKKMSLVDKICIAWIVIASAAIVFIFGAYIVVASSPPWYVYVN
jgi:hypothetical protein